MSSTEDKKEDDYSTGPLSVLTQSVRNNTQVRLSTHKPTTTTQLLFV